MIDLKDLQSALPIHWLHWFPPRSGSSLLQVWIDVGSASLMCAEAQRSPITFFIHLHSAHSR